MMGTYQLAQLHRLDQPWHIMCLEFYIDWVKRYQEPKSPSIEMSSYFKEGVRMRDMYMAFHLSMIE